MPPVLKNIDHVHVYVTNMKEAKHWYENILGFKVIEALAFFADNGGPLTFEHPNTHIRLALFESERQPHSAIAFGASGSNFIAWKEFFEAQSIELRIADHQVVWSMYFQDPFGNSLEITTEDHRYVANHVGK